jgi:hypothetical protein
MDPLSLAGAAVALVLKRMLDDAADEALPAAKRLFAALKQRFAPGGEQAVLLEGVEQDPDTQWRQDALTHSLATAVEQDADFARELTSLVQAAGVNITTGDAGFVAGGNINIRAGNVAGRDINLGSPGST